MTGNGFIEMGLAFPESLFQSTITATLLIITGKYAIFPVDYTGHQVTFFISIYYSLFVDHRLCGS